MRRRAWFWPASVLVVASVVFMAVALFAGDGLGAAVSRFAGPSVGQVETPYDIPGHRLVFADEFAGDALDGGRWRTAMPWGDITYHEQQRYVPEALRVSDGLLTITAEEGQSGDRPYRSGAITSPESACITYGRVEMRARMPEGRGLWPALWLVPKVKDEHTEDEIDVVEVLGHDPRRAYLTLHFAENGGEGQFQSAHVGVDLSRGFHSYAVEWTPGYVAWSIDGIERYRVTEKIPDLPMHVIANLAVGGPDTWPGAPDGSTRLPARYVIDYIRVYQRL